MSRTIATVKRPEPHDYDPDPAAGGLQCRTCRLIERNSVHSKREIAAHKAQLAAKAARVAEAQAAHRRRTGER